MEWIRISIAPLKDLLAFLQKKSKTNDVIKKQLLIELRNNLLIFSNGFLNEAPYDRIIDLLKNDAYQAAVRENFQFKKLKAGKISAKHIREERNKKYAGWDTGKLCDKIDEKITELKNIKQLNNGTVNRVKNHIPLMMGNLYYRMKLLADFIRSGN